MALSPDWEAFFATEVQATAALTGLVIVAMSINLSRILAEPVLPGRAAEALIILGGALLLCSVMIVPAPVMARGLTVIAIASVVWATSLWIQLTSIGQPSPAPRQILSRRIVLGQATTLPMITGGVLVWLGENVGLYCLAAAIILALAVALVHTWVLLIEILR